MKKFCIGQGSILSGDCSPKLLFLGRSCPNVTYNGIRREWGWFATVSMAWRVLYVKVWTGEYSSSAHFPKKQRQSCVWLVTFFLWDNSTPTRSHKRLWTLSRLESENWATLAQTCQQILHFWSDLTLVTTEHSDVINALN